MNGQVYKIKKDSVKIGRSSTNDLMIDDSRLSREHARIDTSNDRYVGLACVIVAVIVIVIGPHAHAHDTRPPPGWCLWTWAASEAAR
jgi:hypothetical protein